MALRRLFDEWHYADRVAFEAAASVYRRRLAEAEAEGWRGWPGKCGCAEFGRVTR